MISFHNSDFVTGIAVSMLLTFALALSTWFRNVSLALAATVIIILYGREGLPGLLAVSVAFQAQLADKPDFSTGLIVGLVVATAFSLGPLRRRS